MAPPEPRTNGSTVFTTLAALPIAAHAGGPWGAGWLFLLIPLLWIGFFALIAFVAFRARRAAFADGHGPRWAAPSRNAESTLAERFAQGDVDEQEYRARLEVLRANALPRSPRKG